MLRRRLAYSDQHQKSGAYAGDTLIVNINAGSGNALQQSDQECLQST